MVTDAEIEEQLAYAGYCLDQAYLEREEEEQQKALKTCTAAIEIMQPLLAEAYNLHGIILEELGRDQEALASYQRALAVKPGLRAAADNLVALESELGFEDRLITIAAFSHQAEAHIPQARLEAEGIWSFIADRETVGANWLYSNAVGGVKLQVRDTDLDRAIEILGIEPPEIEFDDADWMDEEQDDESTCPSCQSDNIHYERFAMRPLFATWLLFGIPLPFLKRMWKCNDCGYEWRWDELPEQVSDQ
ncbi:MAG: hypothetical protein KKA73_24265 [Chloroflexi bacterium]|nr:hypothetical protein [Chloroflexota bacterium]MBU1750808.1 hypothetical protein [Chloroflexota bacterium]MBU1878604.1 hypothetical protein [Chloroflexota bacterium]